MADLPKLCFDIVVATATVLFASTVEEQSVADRRLYLPLLLLRRRCVLLHQGKLAYDA